MTYEEIKTKYANRMRERNTSVSQAANKVERLQTQIEFYTEERERYRQRDGVITANNTQKWNTYTMKLQELNEQLNKAKIALTAAELGADGVKAFSAEIDKFNL